MRCPFGHAATVIAPAIFFFCSTIHRFLCVFFHFPVEGYFRSSLFSDLHEACSFARSTLILSVKGLLFLLEFFVASFERNPCLSSK
ncbi:hypothetical protein CW304_13560 [Bacillus sp. UFRGS-B20]|nr:hypothetical protein CW304_13560 [Bacillus sp. UFRGS-B20]